MILNIFVIIFLVGMAILWSTYGFFSAFLNLLVVLCAGMLAFAFWEPVSHWLLGMGTGSAWGLGLFIPYAVALGLLRVAVIAGVRRNLGFPSLADQIGGAALGLAAGVLTVGILVIGGGNMAPGKDLLGVQDYQLNNIGQVKEKTDATGLWVPVDVWTGNVFESLSAGAFSPSGSTFNLASEHQGLAKAAKVRRLAVDPTATRIASPAGVTVNSVYSMDCTPESLEWLLCRSSAYAVMRQSEVEKIDAEYDHAQMTDFVSDTVGAILKENHDPEKELFDKEYLAEVRSHLGVQKDMPGEVALARLLAYAVDQVPNGAASAKKGAPAPELKLFTGLTGKKLILVDTAWDAAKSNAYDEKALRLSPSQIVLHTASSDKKTSAGPAYLPVAWSAPMISQTFFARRELVELADGKNPGIYGMSAQEGRPDRLAFLFVVPKDASVSSIVMRHLRFPLGAGDVVKVSANLQDRLEMAKLLGHVLPPVPDVSTVQQHGPAKQIGSLVLRDATVDFTPWLPNVISWITPVLGVQVQEDSKDLKLIAGDFEMEQSRGIGQSVLKIQQLLLPSHHQSVRVMLTLAQCQAIWGRQMGGDRGDFSLRLRAESGPLSAVGFIVARENGTSSVHIDCNKGRSVSGKMLDDLRPVLGSKDKVYVYYLVDEEEVLEGLGLWDPKANKTVKGRQYDFPEKVPLKPTSEKVPPKPTKKSK